MLFLAPSQQCQSTEGNVYMNQLCRKLIEKSEISLKIFVVHRNCQLALLQHRKL